MYIIMCRASKWRLKNAKHLLKLDTQKIIEKLRLEGTSGTFHPDPLLEAGLTLKLDHVPCGQC